VIENNHIHKATKQIRRGLVWVHRTVRTFSSLILFLVCTQLTFQFFAYPIFKSVLQRKIFNDSKGVYWIDFEDLSINLSRRSIRIDGFRLIPNMKIYTEEVKKDRINHALYAINFSSLQIKRISILKLLFDNELNIKTIILQKPLVRILSLPDKIKAKTEKYDAIHRDLYPFVAKFLSTLSVENVKIEQGYFDFFIRKNKKRMSSTANNISLELKNFYLDQHSFLKRDKLFYSKSINLKIKDYVMELQDSIHLIRAKKVVASSDSNRIYATKVSINPGQVPENYLIEKQRDIMKINVPMIMLEGADIKQLYFDKSIQISEVLLINPNISIFKITKSKQAVGNTQDTIRKKITANYVTKGIFDLIKGKLESIVIHKFVLDSCQLYVHKNLTKDEPQFQVGAFTLKLSEFLLDSTSYLDNKRIFYSEDFDVNINDFRMIFKDNIHKLKAGYLNISSKNKEIHAKNVRLTPQKNGETIAKSTKKSLFNIYVPDLIISGVDIRKAYNLQILPIDFVTLVRPELNIRNYAEKNDNKKAKKIDFQQLTNDYLKILSVKEMKLEDAKFDVGSIQEDQKLAYSTGKMSISLYKFLLDAKANMNKGKLFNAENFEFKVQDYSIKLTDNLHVLNLKELNVSTIDSSVIITGIHVVPIAGADTLRKNYRKNKDQLNDISIEKIHLSNVDILKAYLEKKLDIGKVKIENPMIRMYKFSQKSSKTSNNEQDTIKKKMKLSDLLKEIKIAEIRINNGKMNFNSIEPNGNTRMSFSNKFEGVLSDYYFITDSVYKDSSFLHSKSSDLLIKSFSLTLPNKVYRLSIREIVPTNDFKTLTIKNMAMIPREYYADSIKQFKTVRFSTPNSIIDGFDLKRFINEKELYAESFVLKKPTLSFVNRTPDNYIDTTKGLKKLSFPETWKFLKIKELKIDSGLLTMVRESGKVRDIFSKSFFDLQAPDFQLDSKVVEKYNLLGYGLETSILKLYNFNINLADSVHQLKSENIIISFPDSLVTGKNFGFTYRKGYDLLPILKRNKKTLVFDINIPDLRLKAMDINMFFPDKLMTSSVMELNNPIFRIFSYGYINPLSKKVSLTKDTIWNILKGIDLYPKISSRIELLTTDSLKMNNASIVTNTCEADTTRNTVTKIDSVYGEFCNFRLDSANIKTNNQLFYTNNIKLKVRNYSVPMSDTIYRLYAGEIFFSYLDKQLIFRDFGWLYNGVPIDFAARNGYRKTVYEMRSKNIFIENMDFDSFFKSRKIIADKVILDNYRTTFSNDRRYPDFYATCAPMPQQMIIRLNNYIKFDSVLMRDSYFSYEEYAPDSKKTGVLEVTDIQANISPLTNDTLSLRNSDTMNISGIGKLMNAGDFKIDLQFSMLAPNLFFTYSAGIKNMNMSALNGYFANTYFVNINSGYIKNLDMNVTSTDTAAIGNMELEYNNLKVQLLNKDKQKTTIGTRIVSLIANTFFIPRDNPAKNKPIRQGVMYLKFDPSQSIGIQMTKTVLDGIKTSLGFSSKDWEKRMKLERELADDVQKQDRLENQKSVKLSEYLHKQNQDKEKVLKKLKKQAKKFEKFKMKLAKKKERQRQRELRRELKMEMKIRKQMGSMLGTNNQ